MLDTSAYYEALREERIMFEEEDERLARHVPKAPPPVSKPLTLLKDETEVVPHRHNAHDDREEN